MQPAELDLGPPYSYSVKSTTSYSILLYRPFFKRRTGKGFMGAFLNRENYFLYRLLAEFTRDAFGRDLPSQGFDLDEADILIS